MKTASRKLTRGGAFILHNTKAHDIFTPEEFNEEQRMMREAIQEFVDRKVWPARKRFDNKDYDYTFELMRKIGEMAFWELASLKHMVAWAWVLWTQC